MMMDGHDGAITDLTILPHKSWRADGTTGPRPGGSGERYLFPCRGPPGRETETAMARRH